MLINDIKICEVAFIKLIFPTVVHYKPIYHFIFISLLSNTFKKSLGMQKINGKPAAKKKDTK